MGQLIFLNGANGAGKSCISKALQKALPQPFLNVEFDHFISMLPQKNDLDAFQHMVTGFHHTIVTLLNCDNHVILGHVLLNPIWLKQLLPLLHDHEVMFIKLFCPLHILEQREKERYGSIKGIAKQQFKAVYQDRTYDLEFDTSKESIESIVESMVKKYLERDFLAFSILDNENR